VRGFVVVCCIAIASSAHAAPQDLPGWPRYQQLCAACHGVRGDGHGAAVPYVRGAPADFAYGSFAWRSTPSGAPPTDEDLRRTIRLGVRETSMPAYAELANEDFEQLIEVIRAFAYHPPGYEPPLPLGPGPALRDPARGAKLWAANGCASCHGDDGRGNQALASHPYDLTAEPLHRPRLGDTPDDRRNAAAWTIETGTSRMPGYAQQIPYDQIWALADRVVELNARAKPQSPAMDAAKTLATGIWPGGDFDEARVFGKLLVSQGPPLPGMTPAETSVSAAQCGRCHAKQLREWQPSLHAGAISVGFAARLADGADASRCMRCHAPLAEQASDAQLQAQGVQCAGCHVRNWTRLGPPNVSPSLARVAGYPAQPSAIYERSDFCQPCHQLPPSTSVAGKPLLDTYKEWLDGPYAHRGVQCQSCHMPNREHEWLGVHDPTTFRQGIRLDAEAHRAGDAIEITAELANIGAGHDLPTTPTPAVWLRLEILEGTRVVGSFEQRIGRDIYWDGQWHERADTRIPPGGSLRVARQWQAGHANAARVTVEVHPDDYYERLYAERLATNPPGRALYEAALRRANGSHYTAETRWIALP
jgi:mono/diheme cytochrome c family protein/ribosomal protein L40E